MLYEINETFYSLQGEGFWTGTPTFFIRLAGCNLNCEWCDTDFSTQEKCSTENLLERAQNSEGASSKRLILTGGEPTRQDIQPLVDAFRRKHWHVAVETNGTGGFIDADWVTVSPKAGVQYPPDLFGDELKIVFDGKINPADFLRHRFRHRFIQPCSGDLKPALQYVLQHPQWRLSLQTHKIMGIK